MSKHFIGIEHGFKVFTCQITDIKNYTFYSDFAGLTISLLVGTFKLKGDSYCCYTNDLTGFRYNVSNRAVSTWETYNKDNVSSICDKSCYYESLNNGDRELYKQALKSNLNFLLKKC